MSKVLQYCIGFPSLHFNLWLFKKKSHHPPNQSDDAILNQVGVCHVLFPALDTKRVDVTLAYKITALIQMSLYEIRLNILKVREQYY